MLAQTLIWPRVTLVLLWPSVPSKGRDTAPPAGHTLMTRKMSGDGYVMEKITDRASVEMATCGLWGRRKLFIWSEFRSKWKSSEIWAWMWKRNGLWMITISFTGTCFEPTNFSVTLPSISRLRTQSYLFLFSDIIQSQGSKYWLDFNLKSRRTNTASQIILQLGNSSGWMCKQKVCYIAINQYSHQLKNKGPFTLTAINSDKEVILDSHTPVRPKK